MKAIYDDKEFFENYIKLRESKLNFNDNIEQPEIKKLLPEITDKKILDLGCGFGDTSKYISVFNPISIIAVDNSKEMLSVAKERNSDKKITYLCIDLEEISKINEKFDIVYSSLVFHYIKDFEKLINDIYNLLSDNGILIFSQEHPLLTCGSMNDEKNKENIIINNYNIDREIMEEWLGKKIVKYHRKMSTIIDCLVNNDFVIQKIVEPIPSEEFMNISSKARMEKHRPSFLIIKCRK